MEELVAVGEVDAHDGAEARDRQWECHGGVEVGGASGSDPLDVLDGNLSNGRLQRSHRLGKEPRAGEVTTSGVLGRIVVLHVARS